MKFQQGKIQTFIIIFFMIGFWVWFFSKAPLARFQSSIQRMYSDVTDFVIELNLTDGISNEEETNHLDLADLDSIQDINECDGELPKHAKLYAVSESFNELKQKSRLIVNNEHLYPVWITLLDIDSLQPISRFYIKPNEYGEFELPIGEYEVEIESGKKWCNLTKGFENASLLDPDGSIDILPNSVKSIGISSFGSTPADMMFFSSNGLSSPRGIQGNGSRVLQRVIGGNYATTGTVNQKPAFFMVDTGASMTTVPYDFAIHAGIKGCEKQHFITANGRIEACVGIAEEVTIGQFVLKNVKVSYGKVIPQDTFLLGMNVLSQFKLLQQDGGMVLSRK